jgi:hypothetical protein
MGALKKLYAITNSVLGSLEPLSILTKVKKFTRIEITGRLISMGNGWVIRFPIKYMVKKETRYQN